MITKFLNKKKQKPVNKTNINLSKEEHEITNRNKNKSQPKIIHKSKIIPLFLCLKTGAKTKSKTKTRRDFIGKNIRNLDSRLKLKEESMSQFALFVVPIFQTSL